jgi:hypothetical protein
MTSREAIQRHEAGHCVSLLVMGVPVRFVGTVGDATRGGWVIYDLHVTDRDSARKQAMNIMCAWIEEFDHLHQLPAWPLDSRAVTSTDEKRLAAIARKLGWTAKDYDRLVGDACKLTLTEPYRILFTAVTGALDYTPRLDTNWIRQLLAIAVRRMEEDDDETHA